MKYSIDGSEQDCPDSKVHVANMGPSWVLSSQGGPHVGPMNLAIRVWLLIWQDRHYFEMGALVPSSADTDTLIGLVVTYPWVSARKT